MQQVTIHGVGNRKITITVGWDRARGRWHKQVRHYDPYRGWVLSAYTSTDKQETWQWAGDTLAR